jgi:micrococcal nuclease
MAKPRLQQEWRLWVSLGLIAAITIGYLWWVSRPPTEGGEALWMVTKVSEARTLSLKGSGTKLQLRLTGVTVPAAQEAAVQEFITKTLQDNWVRIKILHEGAQGVKEGLVFLSGEDIVAALVRQGMAEVDRSETALDIRQYIELEQEAKREKRGVWR